MDLPTPFDKVGKIGSCHKQKLHSDFFYSISLRDLILCLRLGLRKSDLASLTTSSRSHELTTDFSKPFWSCRVRFQVRLQQIASSIRKKCFAVAFDYILLVYRDSPLPLVSSKLQNLNRKIDRDVYCYSLR